MDNLIRNNQAMEPDFDSESRDIIPAESTAMQIEESRAVQQVQAALIIAKKSPRDETKAYARIMQACKRQGLAEQAAYVYPRGGQQVTGPSIRLAETLAQYWGNIDFGIRELEQKNGESIVEAFCWDLETNTRQTKLFTVKHERHSKNGVTKLKDPRDIYETVANQGARRLRACILGIIPGDIVDAALSQCEDTVKAQGKNEPIADRARKMVAAFQEYGVTQELIEKKLGHKLEAIIEQELVNLRRIFQSLKDGMAKRHDFFDLPKPESDDSAKRLNEKFAKKADKKAKEPEQTFDEMEAPSLEVEQ
jgi:hypothetical protein